MIRFSVMALTGILCLAEPLGAAAGQFIVIRCDGLFVEPGARTPLTVLYRIGSNESQV